MPSAALLPLAAWRNEMCRIPVSVPGVDITGNTIRAQARLAPDTPGAALLDLEPTNDANATGIRKLAVTLDNLGVPTSTFVIQITQGAMQALPFAGELGEATLLAYALQIDGQTRMFGTFAVLASPIDSDNAPANRTPGYGSPACAMGVPAGVTLTLGVGGVTASFFGMLEIQRALATVLAASGQVGVQAQQVSGDAAAVALARTDVVAKAGAVAAALQTVSADTAQVAANTNAVHADRVQADASAMQATGAAMAVAEGRFFPSYAAANAALATIPAGKTVQIAPDETRGGHRCFYTVQNGALAFAFDASPAAMTKQERADMFNLMIADGLFANFQGV